MSTTMNWKEKKEKKKQHKILYIYIEKKSDTVTPDMYFIHEAINYYFLLVALFTHGTIDS